MTKRILIIILVLLFTFSVNSFVSAKEFDQKINLKANSGQIKEANKLYKKYKEGKVVTKGEFIKRVHPEALSVIPEYVMEKYCKIPMQWNCQTEKNQKNSTFSLNIDKGITPKDTIFFSGISQIGEVPYSNPKKLSYGGYTMASSSVPWLEVHSVLYRVGGDGTDIVLASSLTGEENTTYVSTSGDYELLSYDVYFTGSTHTAEGPPGYFPNPWYGYSQSDYITIGP